MYLLVASLAFATDPPVTSAPPPAGPEEPPPLTKNPELTGFVQAPYPEEAKAAGLEGKVGLELEIDATGKVVTVTVIRPAGHGFDEAAVEAAKQFVFSPAEDPTGPVPVIIEFDYGFVLDASTVQNAAPEAGAAATEIVNLDGDVREMGTRRPLAGFDVVLVESGETVQTDESGHYAFKNVPLGKATLKVVRPGFATVEETVDVVEGQVTSVRLWLRNLDYNTDAIVGSYARETQDVTRHTISMDEVRRIPGTFGDPVRVVQSLPGAARAPFGSGLLIIRGSDPQDSGVYVDGVRIPYIYHLGGYESVINPELVDSVDYLPGGFGVQYGRGMGGVVDVTLKKKMPDRIQVKWTTDLLDSGGVVQGSVGKENQHGFGVAARRSYIDAFIPIFAGDSGFVVKPVWWDYQARYLYQGSKNYNLSITAFGFQDDLAASTPEGYSQGTDADSQGDLGTTYSTHRLTLRFDTKVTETTKFAATASFGNDYASLVIGDSWRLTESQWIGEVRLEGQWLPSEHLKVGIGDDFLGGLADFQVDLPFNPSDFASTDPLGEREPWGYSDVQTGWGPDPYVYAEIRPLADPKKMLISPGVRMMIYDIPDELLVIGWDPRLTARWNFFGKSVVKGSIGLYHQPPQPFQSYRTDGNPVDLDAEQALSATLGFEQDVGSGFHGEIEGFYKGLSSLIVDNTNFESLDDQYFSNDGIGRVYGVEVLLRREPIDRFFGWLSYTLSRSERLDHPGDAWYPYDYDQTHNFVAVAGYNFPYDISVSTRAQYTTGNPTTDYDLGVYDVDQDSYTGFQTGAYNADRLPPYWAVNFRIDKLFTFKAWQLDLFVDVLNALHGTNPEFEIYNYDYTEKTYVTGLPLIPSPGFQAKFEF